ncbi:hypothetical protein [Vibrio ouci]|uniref:hypothetical protein n=1 Tax=Vibrio ouci TaxID=2499078 RepID=UPI001FC955F4|nr:hypothetical protein [Vibrio ouci]
MKKSLIALIVAGSFALAGCSSSGGSDVNDRDIDPEWGVAPPPVQPPVDNSPDRPQADGTPDWGVDTTPDWGLQPSQPPVDNSPERPQPDVDPDFGVDTTPEWGLQPAQPPIDNSPERPQPDFGDTPGWGGEVGDIHVDGDGVIRFEGKEYQITGYSDRDKEFTITDPDGVTLYARVLDDGRIGIIYNQKVYFLNGHRFAFAPDFDFGVDTTPDWGIVPPPVQPPVDNTPDRPQPDFGDTPDWGVPDTGYTPERPRPDFGNTPDWGVEPPLDRPQPDFGETPDWGVEVGERPEKLPPTWGGECGSPDGGANCDPIPPKPPTGISTAPEVSPAINNIDRNKVRDAVRSRLNG